MATRSVQRYCLACDSPVLAEKQRPAHVLHLLLTLLTGGLWLIVWLGLSLPSTPRCPHCGSGNTLGHVPRAARPIALSRSGVAAMPRRGSLGWTLTVVIILVLAMKALGT